MSTEDDAHAEIRKQISEVHDRVTDLIKGQGAAVRWALAIVASIWITILGYIYRIDISVLAHHGASKTIVDRLDETFDNIELNMKHTIDLNEKDHIIFRRKIESCERRLYRLHID